MTAHSQNSSQKISPNKLKERLFLAGIAEKIANILSLPQTGLICDIPSDILPTEYVSHIVVQLSRICEKHRVAFRLPENKESSQHGGMGHFISLIRGHCPNGYIGDHMRLGDSPRSVPIGGFGELLVPLDSRITRYGHFVSTLNNSLEKLSTELDYRGEKERQIEVMQSAFEKRLDQYITEACTDPLTGISNRRAMVNYMAGESKAINSEGTPRNYYIATIDLDFFKRVNDTGGHALGDRVLKQFVAVLTRITSQKGIKAHRTGGEEFTLVWPSAVGGREILEEIQGAIAQDPVKLGNSDEEISKTKDEIKTYIRKYAELSVRRKKKRTQIRDDSALDSDQKDRACEVYDMENPLPTPPMKCTEGFNSIKYTASIGFAEIEISPREKIEDVLDQFNAGWKLSDGASYDAKKAGRDNIQQRTSLEGLPEGGRVRDVPMGEQPLTLHELSEQLRILGFDYNITQEILGITQTL